MSRTGPAVSRSTPSRSADRAQQWQVGVEDLAQRVAGAVERIDAVGQQHQQDAADAALDGQHPQDGGVAQSLAAQHHGRPVGGAATRGVRPPTKVPQRRQRQAGPLAVSTVSRSASSSSAGRYVACPCQPHERSSQSNPEKGRRMRSSVGPAYPHKPPDPAMSGSRSPSDLHTAAAPGGLLDRPATRGLRHVDPERRVAHGEVPRSRRGREPRRHRARVGARPGHRRPLPRVPRRDVSGHGRAPPLLHDIPAAGHLGPAHGLAPASRDPAASPASRRADAAPVVGPPGPGHRADDHAAGAGPGPGRRPAVLAAPSAPGPPGPRPRPARRTRRPRRRRRRPGTGRSRGRTSGRG